MKHTLISVIIPIYKVEPYLNKCVESIVNQTYQNLEIILVDDGSPDHCPQMCDEWAKKDRRIRVIHKENGGLSDARNAGIETATGEYIAFVDSDDFVEPVYIQELYCTLTENHADLAICSFLFERPDGTLKKDCPIIPEGIWTGRNFLVQSTNWGCVVAWNKLYKKSLWDTIKFPVGKQHEDEFVYHQILYACAKVVSFQKPLYHYIENQTGIMRQKFSIRNLDHAEAMLDRIQFLLKHHITECIAQIINSFIYWDIYRIHKNLDMSEAVNRNRVRELLNQLKALFPSIAPYLSKKQKLVCRVICMAPFASLRVLYAIQKLKSARPRAQ